VQWSFRKTGTMETLASQAVEIGVWIRTLPSAVLGWVRSPAPTAREGPGVSPPEK